MMVTLHCNRPNMLFHSLLYVTSVRCNGFIILHIVKSSMVELFFVIYAMPLRWMSTSLRSYRTNKNALFVQYNPEISHQLPFSFIIRPSQLSFYRLSYSSRHKTSFGRKFYGRLDTFDLRAQQDVIRTTILADIDTCPEVFVTEQDVRNSLLRPRPKKARGPDGISGRVLKE